jgi:hypothetical protein
MTVNNGGNVPGAAIASPAISGLPQSLSGMPVTNPNGLRRWRGRRAGAFGWDCPIVCTVDSHTFGQLANGNNSSLNTDRAADAQLGYVGQLRNLFAQTYGAPGEGFQFPANVADSRITEGGSPAFFGAHGQSPSVSLINRRLTSGAMSLTITVPTGATRVRFTQANFAGNNSSTWTLNGVAQGAVNALTGTGIPITTGFLPVVAGQPVVITGPASGNDTFLGFEWRTAQTFGVPIHGLGVGGQTQWRLQGGVFNGQVGTADGINFYTAAEQLANNRACYQFTGTPTGLLIIYTGTNEQGLQLGAAGLNNGVTPTIMGQGVQFMVNNAVADGWCCLLVGPPASASEILTGSFLPAYTAQLQQIAAGTDHCAMVDISDLWGGDSSAAKTLTSNAGLRDPGSSHPTMAGYGDIALALYRVLTDTVPLGN